MSAARPLSRPLALAGIAVAAAVWSVAVLGTTGRVPVAVAGVTALLVFLAVLRRFPGVTTACLPVLLVPSQQIAELFAYELYLGGAFCVLCVIGWRNRSAWLGRLSWLEVFVLAQLGWGVLSIFWSTSVWFWLFGVKVYVLGFVAFWVASRMSRFVDGEILLAGIPAGACALGLAVIAQAARAGFFGSINASYMRSTATDVGWGLSNYLAAIVAMMLPTGVYLALNARRRWVRLVGWASIPLSASLVTVGASRGGAVMLLAIALFAIFRSRIKPWIAVVAAVVLVGFMVVGPGGALLMSRFTSVTDAYSMVVRLVYYREAWTRTVEHWPLGMGLEQGMVSPDRLGEDDPHNYWLSLSSELGLIGVLLWIAISAHLWVRIRRMIRDPEREQAGRALQLTLIVVHLNLLFEPTMPGVQYQAFFYWIFGIYLGVFDRDAFEGEASGAVAYNQAAAASSRPRPERTRSPDR